MNRALKGDFDSEIFQWPSFSILVLLNQVSVGVQTIQDDSVKTLKAFGILL